MTYSYDYSHLSDESLQALFRRTPAVSGERLVIYPELRKRNLALSGEVTLFKSRPGLLPTPENSREMFLGLIMAYLASLSGFKEAFLVGLFFAFDGIFKIVISRSLVVTNKKILTSFFFFRIFGFTREEISLEKSSLYLCVNYFSARSMSGSTLYVRSIPRTGQILRCRLYPQATLNLIPPLLFFLKQNNVNFYLDPIPQKVFQTASCIERPFDSPTLENFCRTFNLDEIDEKTAINLGYDFGWLRLIYLLQNSRPPKWLACGDDQIENLLNNGEQFIFLTKHSFSFQHWGRSKLIFTQKRIIAVIRGINKKVRFEASSYPDVGLPVFGGITMWRDVEVHPSRHVVSIGCTYPVIAIIEHFATCS
jgi:hypothetical protein